MSKIRFSIWLVSLHLLAACSSHQSLNTEIAPPSVIEKEVKQAEPNFEVVEHEVVQDSKQDEICATCIYVDGTLLGQTAVGLKSRKKKWAGRLPEGNHLIEFERWTFPGDSLWFKDQKMYQPKKRFIRVNNGSKTHVSIKFYNNGKQHSFDISKENLTSPSTAQLEMTPMEKMINRLGFCPLSPEYEGTSFSNFWTKKRILTISNPGPALTDYPLEIEIPFDTNMAPDFGDLRFFDLDGNSLPFWIKEYADSQGAKVLVKTHAIPSAESKLTMYYGNAQAANVSQPKDFFIYNDNFENFDGRGVMEGTTTIDGLSSIENTEEESDTLLYCKELPRGNPLSIEARIKIQQPPLGFIFQDKTEGIKQTLLFHHGDYELDGWVANDGQEDRNLTGLGFPLNQWQTVAFSIHPSMISIGRSYSKKPAEEKTYPGAIDSFCITLPKGQGQVSLDYVRVQFQNPEGLTFSLGEAEDR